MDEERRERRYWEERRERQYWEALRFRFEFFKQISTLGAAVSVVVVALYRDIALTFPVVVIALVAFGVSVLVAVFGMWWNSMNPDLAWPRLPGWLDLVLAVVCFIAFGVGAGVVLFGALAFAA